jgi:hypothetical protein
LVFASNVRAILVAVCCGNINRRNLNRAATNAYDADGFLVGSAGFARGHPRVGPGLLREDVSTRPPARADRGNEAGATILVIGFAPVVLSDHGASRAATTNPASPLTSVSAFLMLIDSHFPSGIGLRAGHDEEWPSCFWNISG